MAKEILTHEISDWSKIDEKEAFWGRINLLKPEINFGIHKYGNGLWTSGLVGIGRLFDKDDAVIQDNGREHILIVSSSYGLNPWKMLEKVLLDKEYDDYTAELEKDNKYLFRIFYDQPLIKLPQSLDNEAELLFALSFVNACHSLCKKGLKKSLVYRESNFTAKLRGKIDVNRNIKNNTVRGRCDKFYCKYIDFTEDTVENRILKAALIKCQLLLKKKFVDNSDLNNKIRYCLNAFKHVKTVMIRGSDFKQVSVGGLYSYYKPIIQQARAILEKNFNSYTENGIAPTKKDVYTIPYVINMETLFEYYARSVLKGLLIDTSYIVEKYSTKYYLQEGVQSVEEAEHGIHLMSYCIPDIMIYDSETNKPVIALDAKYKPDTRSDRHDSHQLLAYVLLTGVKKCVFVLPGEKTTVKMMKTSGNNYLPLTPGDLNYYELILGDRCDINDLAPIMT